MSWLAGPQRSGGVQAAVAAAAELTEGFLLLTEIRKLALGRKAFYVATVWDD